MPASRGWRTDVQFGLSSSTCTSKAWLLDGMTTTVVHDQGNHSPCLLSTASRRDVDTGAVGFVCITSGRQRVRIWYSKPMPQQLCLTSCGSDGNDAVRESWLPPNRQCRCAFPRLKPCCRCTACASAFRPLSTPSVRHQELALYSARLATASHGGQRQTERCAHCDGLWPVILCNNTVGCRAIVCKQYIMG